MKIGIITPAPPGSRYGNRVTALRWARILRKLGHRVTLKQDYEGEEFDLLVALHARKSHAALRAFHQAYPQTPIIVGLTGTDVYRDIRTKENARESLWLARRLIVLQPKAIAELPTHERGKARVIYQSVEWKPGAKTQRFRRSRRAREQKNFDVCVIGHLRPVKDPFRAATAARLLPLSSRVRILQVGGAMSEAMAARARKAREINPRYRWLGEQSRSRVHEILSRSQLCLLTSKMEGGANVLGEAIVAGVPVLASHVSGSVGILGESYPGYFEVGDTSGLARLLLRAENDSRFLDGLDEHCRRLAPLFGPAREEKAWAALLDELFS
jgi:putative glycosyltransferase (TIGR04348 family)